jgi:hypothetical protein
MKKHVDTPIQNTEEYETPMYETPIYETLMSLERNTPVAGVIHTKSTQPLGETGSSLHFG